MRGRIIDPELCLNQDQLCNFFKYFLFPQTLWSGVDMLVEIILGERDF